MKQIQIILGLAALLSLPACSKENVAGDGTIPPLRDVTVKVGVEKAASGAWNYASAGKVHYRTDAGDEATVELNKDMTFTAAVSAEAKTIQAFVGATEELTAVPSETVKTHLDGQEDLKAAMAAWSDPAELGASSAEVTLKPFTAGMNIRLFDSRHFALDERVLEITFSSSSTSKLTWKSDDPLVALRVSAKANPGTAGMAVAAQAAADAKFTVVTDRNSYDFTVRRFALEAGAVRTVDLDFSYPDIQPVRKVGILGDSISTFAGYIDPSYSAWYPSSDANGTGTVQSVEKTYWWKVIYEKMEYGELDVNNSYSGTKVVTEGGVKGFVDRAYRFKDPDIIIIHGGTNDKNQSSPMGDYGFDLPMGQLNDMNYRSAYVKLIKMLQTRYEGVQLIILVGDTLTPEYARVNVEIAQHFGLPCVDFTKGGTITNDKTNLPKSSGSHPDAKGHQYMADRIYDTCKDYLP